MSRHSDRGGSGRPKGASEDAAPTRKELQLCAQIRRSIELTLLGDCDDEVMQNLEVQSVEPAPGNRLLVTLVPHPPGSTMPRAEVLARVEAHRAILIREVMAAVTRRSLPELSFWIGAPATEASPPEASSPAEPAEPADPE